MISKERSPHIDAQTDQQLTEFARSLVADDLGMVEGTLGKGHYLYKELAREQDKLPQYVHHTRQVFADTLAQWGNNRYAPLRTVSQSLQHIIRYDLGDLGSKALAYRILSYRKMGKDASSQSETVPVSYTLVDAQSGRIHTREQTYPLDVSLALSMRDRSGKQSVPLMGIADSRLPFHALLVGELKPKDPLVGHIVEQISTLLSGGLGVEGKALPRDAVSALRQCGLMIIDSGQGAFSVVKSDAQRGKSVLTVPGQAHAWTSGKNQVHAEMVGYVPTQLTHEAQHLGDIQRAQLAGNVPISPTLMEMRSLYREIDVLSQWRGAEAALKWKQQTLADYRWIVRGERGVPHLEGEYDQMLDEMIEYPIHQGSVQERVLVHARRFANDFYWQQVNFKDR